MAVSTERTVRDVLVTAIRGVASQLGFAEPSGNVKDYPLEMHQEEQVPAYLRAKVGNAWLQRAWAVDVRGFDELFALRQVAKRSYSISVIGYYQKGVNGAGYKDLVDHARVIRGAINAISPTLDGTVTLLTGATQLAVSELSAAPDTLLVGVMTYSAERTNPDF